MMLLVLILTMVSLLQSDIYSAAAKGQDLAATQEDSATVAAAAKEVAIQEDPTTTTTVVAAKGQGLAAIAEVQAKKVQSVTSELSKNLMPLRDQINKAIDTADVNKLKRILNKLDAMNKKTELLALLSHVDDQGFSIGHRFALALWDIGYRPLGGKVDKQKVRNMQEIFEMVIDAVLPERLLSFIDLQGDTLLHFICFLLPVVPPDYIVQATTPEDWIVKNNTGKTPLDYVCAKKDVSYAEIKPILAKQNNPLDVIVKYDRFDWVIPYIQEKTQEGQPITQTEKNRLLLAAAAKGHTQTVKTLIKMGADVNAQDTNKNTALRLAAQNGHVQTVEYLINYKAENNDPVQLEEKNLLLLIAAAYGHTQTVKTLIKLGSNVKARDGKGHTVLDWAAGRGHIQTVKYLINYRDKNNDSVEQKEKNDALLIAAANGHVYTVKELIRLGANVMAVGEHQQTLWHSAAQNGHANVINDVDNINKNADLNAANADGATPLHLAVKNNHMPVIKALIQKGVNVNATTITTRINPLARHETPLHWAAQSGNTDAVTALLAAGANPNAQDEGRRTPLHWAIQNKGEDVVTTLLAKGAHLNAQDHEQQTPLHLAYHLVKPDAMTSLLLAKGAKDYAGHKPGAQQPVMLSSLRGHA